MYNIWNSRHAYVATWTPNITSSNSQVLCVVFFSAVWKWRAIRSNAVFFFVFICTEKQHFHARVACYWCCSTASALTHQMLRKERRWIRKICSCDKQQNAKTPNDCNILEDNTLSARHGFPRITEKKRTHFTHKRCTFLLYTRYILDVDANRKSIDTFFERTNFHIIKRDGRHLINKYTWKDTLRHNKRTECKIRPFYQIIKNNVHKMQAHANPSKRLHVATHQYLCKEKEIALNRLNMQNF